jgi:hypothetical protein
VTTPELRFLDEIPIDERHTLHQLLGRFQTVKDGLPELVKNAKDQYSRHGIADAEDRIIVVILSSESRRIGVLDFAGASREDFRHWLTWSDPRASRIEAARDIEGRHGNGGKGFMVRGSMTTAFLEACFEGRRTKMGFRNDVAERQYFPAFFVEGGTVVDDVPVADARPYLEANLAALGTDFEALPEAAQRGFEDRQCYTAAIVNDVRDWVGRRLATVRQLIDEVPAVLQTHPQAALTVETCKVWVLRDGKLMRRAPLRREYPEPLEGFERPRRRMVPGTLPDPDTDEPVSTGGGDRATKYLSLRTSRASLRMPGRRPLNVIRICNERNVVASWSVADLYPQAQSAYVYGELQVPALESEHLAGADRSILADTALVRALREWVSAQIQDLCGEIQQAMAEDYDATDRRRVNRELRQFRRVMSDFLDRLDSRRESMPDLPGDEAEGPVDQGDLDAVLDEGDELDGGTDEALGDEESEAVDQPELEHTGPDALASAGEEQGDDQRREDTSPRPTRSRHRRSRTIADIVLEPGRDQVAIAEGTTVPLVTRVTEVDDTGRRYRARAPELEMLAEPQGVVSFVPDGALVCGEKAGRTAIALRDPKTGTQSAPVEVEVVVCRDAVVGNLPDGVLRKAESVELRVEFDSPAGRRDDLLVEASLDEPDMGRINREAVFTAGRHEGTALVRVRYGPKPGQTVAAEIEIGEEHMPDRQYRRAEGGRIPYILVCGTPAPGMTHYPPEQRTVWGGPHEPTIIDFEPQFEHVIWINPASEESVHARQGRGGRRGVAGIGTKSYLRFLAIKCFEILKRLYVRQRVMNRLISEAEFRRLFAQAEIACAPFVDQAYEIAESLTRGR